MKNLYLILSAVVLAAFVSSCSSGIKALQSGDYYDAVLKSVERLRSDPGNKKARAALAQAYPLAVADGERQAALAPASRDVRTLENNIKIYTRLNRLSEEIYRCPAAMSVIPAPREYRNELRETMDLVGPLYYEQGMAALAVGTLDAAREAYDCLSRTAHYTPGYKDVAHQLDRARYAATLRVVVTSPVTPGRYQLDAMWFYDKLMSEITAATYRNLVRFYTSHEAKAERMTNPHQVLYLDFADFTVGNTAQNNNTVELVRDDVVVGTTTVNGQKQNVMGTVKAKYTSHRMEIISQGILTLRITDGYSSRVLYQKALPGKSVWASEWASFNGDERALSSQQLALTHKKQLALPSHQELFHSFASPLYAQASSFIGYTYSRQ